MNLSTLGTIAKAIASIAPTLATMLAGPLAGTAVSALEGVLGLKPGSGPDAISQVLQAGTLTPDQVAAMHAADLKHAEVLRQQDVDLAKINADHDEAFAKIDEDDRASARARETTVKDWIPGTLAIGITTGFFGVLGCVMYFGVKIGQGQGGEAVLLLLGSLGTAWTAVVSYYFGSSAGARRSAEALAQIAKQP